MCLACLAGGNAEVFFVCAREMTVIGKTRFQGDGANWFAGIPQQASRVVQANLGEVLVGRPLQVLSKATFQRAD